MGHLTKRSAVLVVVLTWSGCQRLTAPTAQGTIDTLDFVVGDPASWPRLGSQAQDQLLEDHRVCWVKYGDRAMFECWRWDETWIYHDVDHGIDGGSGESYSFTDGRWLPRQLPVTGWTQDMAANRIRWFDANCHLTEHGEHAGMPGLGLFPYRQTARLDGDTLVLEYQPHAPGESGSPERFFFRKGKGWYRWESIRGAAWFDSPGGVSVGRSSACAAQCALRR
jgi:hypothetical protein